jgi:signal peptidase II
MNASPDNSRARISLIIPLVLVIIVLDQLSKAWFVFRLGTHQAASFGEFAARYFAIWGANGGDGAVTSHFFPFKPGIDVWSPWIKFNLTTNTGAAWSMFAGNSFVLSGVSLLMAVLLVYVWWRSFRFHRSMTWALGGIIGGALGNFFDRFRLKEVVDFIDVRIPYIGRVFHGLGDPYDFPIFNVADSCAVLGTLALAIYLIAADIRAMRRRREHGAHPDDDADRPVVATDQPQRPADVTQDQPGEPAATGAPETNSAPPDEAGEPAPAGKGESDGSQRP